MIQILPGISLYLCLISISSLSLSLAISTSISISSSLYLYLSLSLPVFLSLSVSFSTCLCLYLSLGTLALEFQLSCGKISSVHGGAWYRRSLFQLTVPAALSNNDQHQSPVTCVRKPLRWFQLQPPSDCSCATDSLWEPPSWAQSTFRTLRDNTKKRPLLFMPLRLGCFITQLTSSSYLQAGYALFFLPLHVVGEASSLRKFGGPDSLL